MFAEVEDISNELCKNYGVAISTPSPAGSTSTASPTSSSSPNDGAAIAIYGWSLKAVTLLGILGVVAL